MKLTKSLFMLCAAGLSLCACNSDDDVAQLEGLGAVEVTIVPPTTRATIGTTGNNDEKVAVTGDVYVTLTATTGGGTIKIDADDFTTSEIVKFWNVTNPTKVEVSMNGGVANYDNINITEKSTKTTYNVGFGNTTIQETKTIDMQAAPASIPVYGVATSDGGGLTLTSDVETNEGKSYKMWKATIKPEIPVARLEVSVTRTSASTVFSTLNVAGVYLDNIKPTGATQHTNYYSSKDAAYNAQSNPTGTATGVSAAILEDPYEQAVSFNTSGARIPESGKVFAYNFYGSDESGKVPQFKIYFTNAASSTQTIPAKQYAIISSYKLTADGEPIALENGHIYRVKDIILSDLNVQPDESGADLAYAVSVVVEQAEWTIKDVTGVWDN